MKSKVSLLMLAILAISVLAAFPVPVRADPANFGYTYPIVENPDFAYVGELAPGEWSPWVTVNVKIETGANEQITFPVNQKDGWFAEVTDSNNNTWSWAVEAVPGPTYTWNSATDVVTVQIQVQVPENWTETCNHTFNVKLKPGSAAGPGNKKVGSGDGVHFKVCIKIPPTEVPISIVKSANVTMAHVGDTIRYSYNVTNTGNVPLTNIYIDDNVTGTIDVAYSLDPGEWILVYSDYTVPDGTPDPLVNNATVTASYGSQQVSAWDTCSVDILHPSIDVIKSANATMIHAGDWVEYNVTVVNTGDCDLEVTLEDKLLVISWSGTLKPGEKYEVIKSIQPTDDPTVNTANATGVDPLGMKVYDEDSWTVDILHPAISVTKEANATRAYAGDVIEYTINVTNVGDCTLYNVNVTDTLLGTIWTGNLEYGESKIFNMTYTVKAGDPDPLNNTVTTYGYDELGMKVEDSAECSVDLIAKICGYKFYDTNANGKWDYGESGVAGITIELWLGNLKINETTTGPDGSYCFDELNAGIYVVKEVLRNGWMGTTSTSIEVDLESGEISEDNNFGNIRLGAGGARTLGYWTNKNGQKDINTYWSTIYASGVLSDNIFAGLPNTRTEAPYLRSAGEIGTFLIRATAVNMRYMLAAQWLTMQLNVLTGKVDGNSLIYIGDLNKNGIADPNEFMKVNEVLSKVSSEWKSWSRAEMEFWKNVLDLANNNKNFLLPPP